MTVRGRSTIGRCEVVARQADDEKANKRRCEPHGQIKKRLVRSPRTPEGGQALKRN